MIFKLGEVFIFDKSKANILLALGFKYKEKVIDNKTVYVFIQTRELMNELTSKFEDGSFLLNRTVNF